MIDLGTTQRSKLGAADGTGWVRLGAVPAADAITRAKGNKLDDVVAMAGRDVYMATTTHLHGPADAGSAIELALPNGERLGGAVLYADRGAPEPPLPAWRQNVAYVGSGAVVLGAGLLLASINGLLAASLAMPAFVAVSVGFLAVMLAKGVQL